MNRKDIVSEINIIIPMAGLGSRFVKYGFFENKYLLPINKHLVKMIEKAILTLNVPSKARFIFILREEEEIDYKLREYLQNICLTNKYNFEICSVKELTEGPASTVYIAKDFINNDIPLIVSNSDQILDWDFDKFYNECEKYDGCVLTYTPKYDLIIGTQDKHSFVRFENNLPVEFVEKKVISEEALVGVHYYKKGKYFIEAYEHLFRNNIRAPNGEFYLSYTYQALLDIGGFSIGTSKLTETEHFYPVGEPEDYFNYYNKYSFFLIKKISDFESINNTENYKHFFQIEKKTKGEHLITNNELIIKITDVNNEIPNVFLTGKQKLLDFEEDAYFLRIFNINKDFNVIDTNNYTRGWLIGDFEPSIQKESKYEIGLLTHKKGEKWGFHYHRESVEINILIKGRMIINNMELNDGDIFIFDKNIIACPIFLEDCKLICIKIPSVPGDKFII
jgi:dTDP-glucose pyrophosphorylase/mannose-6-phosphate isomerase-like protein (cupin superfamily)